MSNDHRELGENFRRNPVPAPPSRDDYERGEAEGGAEAGGGGFQVRQYTQALARFKWLIAAAGVLGMGLSFGVFLLTAPVYTTRATLEVFGRNENFMNLGQVDPQAGTGLYSATSSNLQTQIQLLMSASLRKKVIERLRLQPLPAAASEQGLMEQLRRKLRLTPEDDAERAGAALAMAVKTFRPAVIRETRVIEIQCQSTSAEVAALFLNTLVEEYIDQAMASRSTTSSRTSEWLVNQVTESKARLGLAEKKLADFRRTTGYTAPTVQETLSGSRLQQLRAELSAVQTERIAKQAEWERLAAAPAEALAIITNDAQLQAGQTSLLDLRRQLAELLTTFTREHPTVRKLAAQVAEVEATVAADRKAVLDRAKMGYETALQRERLLSNAYGSQNRVFNSETSHAGQRSQLEREVEAALQTYNSLVQQVNQASMATATPSEYVRTIDEATPEVQAGGLSLIPVMILGLFSGVLFGATAVVAGEATSQTLKNPHHTTQIFQAPEMAVIPTLPKARLQPAPHGPLTNNGDLIPGSNAVEVWKGQPSLYVESFRRAITMLMLAGEHVSGCQMLVVTSPGPAEGKTTVVSNLGIALAEAGRRVLLIDMDLRQPGLQRTLGEENAMGIAETVLAGIGGEASPPLPFIRPTRFAGLSLLPATRIDPSQLPVVLFHPHLRQLLTRLREDYDFILIDTPPAGLFPEARVLGGMSDGVILVVREGKTSREAAIDVRARLAEDATPLIGTILNDSMMKTYESGYYKYYQSSGKG